MPRRRDVELVEELDQSGQLLSLPDYDDDEDDPVCAAASADRRDFEAEVARQLAETGQLLYLSDE